MARGAASSISATRASSAGRLSGSSASTASPRHQRHRQHRHLGPDPRISARASPSTGRRVIRLKALSDTGAPKLTAA